MIGILHRIPGAVNLTFYETAKPKTSEQAMRFFTPALQFLPFRARMVMTQPKCQTTSVVMLYNKVRR